jgi:hypothetical protein
VRSLVPRLVDIPFAGATWEFEKGATTPTTRRAHSHGHDWRLSYGPAVTAYFRDYVLSDARIFDFLDRKRVEAVLRTEPHDARTVWCIATLTTLVNGDWLRSNERNTPLSVPLD